MTEFTQNRLPDFTYASVTNIISNLKEERNKHFAERIIKRGLEHHLHPQYESMSKPVQRNHLHKEQHNIINFVEDIVNYGEIYFSPCEVNEKFPNDYVFKVLHSAKLNSSQQISKIIEANHPSCKSEERKLKKRIKELQKYVSAEGKFKIIDSSFYYKKQKAKYDHYRATGKNANEIVVPPKPEINSSHSWEDLGENHFRAYVIWKDHVLCLNYSFNGQINTNDYIYDPYSLIFKLSGITYLKFENSKTAETIRHKITTVSNLIWFNSFIHRVILPRHVNQYEKTSEHYEEEFEEKYLLSILDEKTKWKAIFYRQYFESTYLDNKIGEVDILEKLQFVHAKIISLLKNSSLSHKNENVRTNDDKAPTINSRTRLILPTWFSDLVEGMSSTELNKLQNSHSELDKVAILYWHLSQYLQMIENKTYD